MYDFDRITDRKNTGSIKIDLISKERRPQDTIPLWVADMDFETAPEIRAALIRAAEHGIYGYTTAAEEYFSAVENWFASRVGWQVQREWMLQTPGVVFALAAAVRAFTKPGDHILIQRPVYHPFTRVIEQNGRVVVNNPLLLEEGRYHIDYEDFEAKITGSNVKMFILCNPHNPVGRVWSPEELRRMGDICNRHKVFVVSDEIHCDFIRPDFCHTNYATLGREYEQNSMICTSPSKTFNLAGLQVSNIFIPNEEMRAKMQREQDATAYHEAGLFGLAACQAAYTHGGPWLEELLAYLEGNLAYIKAFVKERLPQIHLIEPEGTYLLWFDVRGYGYSPDQIRERLRTEARLWLNEGDMFGPEGAGFIRLNMASPRGVIEQAMERLLLL